MKYTLPLATPLIILFLLISLCATPAQNPAPPPRPAAASGQPMPPPGSLTSTRDEAFRQAIREQAMRQGMGAVDPATGLPIKSEWKDPNWDDPPKVVKDINYPTLPIKEVADDLKHMFDLEFDVLLPNDFESRGQNNMAFEGHDWLETKVTMQLKDVKASEIFNAMNMLFENNRTPLRWELRMNGNRRIALLRVVAGPGVADVPGRPLIKRVYFVGDIADVNYGGMGMADLVKTISEVWNMAYGQASQPGTIQFHKQAQLLIVTGTDDQVNFIQSTLQELRLKAQSEHAHRQMEMIQKNMHQPKPDGSAGPDK